MHGSQRLSLSFALLANYVPKCQMSLGPYGPIFFYKSEYILVINLKVDFL